MTAQYFILASFHPHGTAWVERDPNNTGYETTVADLMSGQIDKPLQVIEVNIGEGTSRDVSEDIARTIGDRAHQNGERLSWGVWAFVNDNTSTAFARGLEPLAMAAVRNLMEAAE